MNYRFLMDDELDEIEWRYQELQRMAINDMGRIIQEVKAYRDRKRPISPSASHNYTFDELPNALEAKHIQKILGISERKVYEFLQNPPFKVVTVGRTYKVSKRVFFEWFEGE